MGKHIFKHKNKNEHDFLTFKGKKSRNDTGLNKTLEYFSFLNEKT